MLNLLVSIAVHAQTAPKIAALSPAPVVSPASVSAQNATAAKFEKSDTHCDEASGQSGPGKGARASIQIIAKSMIQQDGNGGFKVTTAQSPFCVGHPLATEGNGPVESAEAGRSLDKTKGIGSSTPTLLDQEHLTMRRPIDSTKPCSGFLFGDDSTIATAAHCLHGESVKDFCNDNAIVFHHACGQTTFTKDEIFDCDRGTQTMIGLKTPGFNLHSDAGSKDHAVLHLTKHVPASTALPLQVRTTPLKTGESTDYRSFGYPGGHARAEFTLKAHSTLTQGNYCFHQMSGYIMRGASGGPVVDDNGDVVGINASVDDKAFGDEEQREPLVRVGSSSTQARRTQVPTKPVRVDAIGLTCRDSKIQRDVAAVRSDQVPCGGDSTGEAPTSCGSNESTAPAFTEGISGAAGVK